MSYGKPPAQQLRARTIKEGVEDYIGEADMRHDPVISFLNRRFPYGLSERTHGLPLPNDLDMAQAALEQSVTPVCYQQMGDRMDPMSRLIDPAHEQYSFFIHSDEDGWHRAGTDSPIFDQQTA